MNESEIVHALMQEDLETLMSRAGAVRTETKGDDVYLRGIIEFSNHCVRNCLYCGLRRANTGLPRYRMRPQEVVDLALRIADLGIGTVVLQSGDDLDYPAQDVAWMVREISRRAEMIVTLSLGERDVRDYAIWREAGAQRYLMKHETSDAELYDRMHPGKHLHERLTCLKQLRELGYEIGSGFIIGLPGQTPAILARDILLIREIGADMCGVGPFLPQAETPLGAAHPGSVETTLRVTSLLRLTSPHLNLPATTALASLDPANGHYLALRAGANVIMPNFTPEKHRKAYRIYDHKTPVGLRLALSEIGRAGRRWVRDGRLKEEIVNA